MKILPQISVFVLLVFLQLLPSRGNTADKPLLLGKQPIETNFETKYPNGLYLYKSKEGNNEFSPLFIVKEGRLFDPYIIAEKIGEDKFYDEYVKGKTFNVAIYSKNVGKISDLRLHFEKRIQTDEFVKDIESNGTYSGNDLQVDQYFKKSFYIEKDFYKFAIPKFIATPLSYHEENKGELSLTEEDREKARETVRKHLFPEAKRIVSEKMQKENRVVGDDHSSINFAWAIDLGRDGKKKTIIACYSINFLLYQKQEGDIRQGYSSAGYWGFEILFVIRENGKIEKISFDDGSEPAFSFINAIDLNGDGVKEIIIEISKSPENEPFFGGKSIAIFSSNTSGWELVFQSAKIAKSIN